MRHLVRVSAVVLLLAVAVTAWFSREAPDPPLPPTSAFESDLDQIRRDLDIPGMSAAVAVGEDIVWARGFGWADAELNIPAAPDTMYHLASLTKPYAATVVLQLVSEQRLTLDASVASLRGASRADGATVEHLLSHTSSPPPGTKYKYDGEAYGELEDVIRHATGRPFAAELASRILKPLGLEHTAPNPQDPDALVAAGTRIANVQRRLARGYAKKWGRRVWPTGVVGPQMPIEYPSYFGTSAGLVASAVDVARFSAALDRGIVLAPEWVRKSQSQYVSAHGKRLPYGLGWFVQNRNGQKVVWHYGHWFGSSSIIVKVPDLGLTFVVLANSDGLSRRRRLGERADVMASPVANVFFQKILPMFRARRQRGAG